MNPPTHILYHANCADGFAAATIASAYFIAPKLYPINYGDAVQMPPAERGDIVIYLDYTPPEAVFAQLEQRGCHVTVIDHHSGRAEQIHQRASELHFESVFDRGFSGAELTWMHFSKDAPIPPMISLIGWRDLGHAWQSTEDPGKNEQALNLHAYLMRCIPRVPEAWSCVILGGTTSSAWWALQELGQRMREKDAVIIRAAVSEPYYLIFEDLNVPAVHGLAPELNSDAMNELLKDYPLAPYAASWYVSADTGRVTYSLRSRKVGRPDHVNVAEVAARMEPGSGGGHPCAAGFSSFSPIPFV